MTTPIPIAFGITDLDVGGAEKALVALVTRLDPGKWTPSVVCLRPMGKLGERLAAAGIECQSLGLTSAWQTLRGLKDWTAILKERKPQAVVSFLFHANILGRFAARRAGVPIHISSVRVSEQGVEWHPWLDWLTHRLSHRYVCVSAGVAEHTWYWAGVPDSKITVIPNGVDLAAVDAALPVDLSEYGISPEDLVLVFLGRLDVQKNPETLAWSVDQIREEAKAHRLRIVIVGEGPQRERLESSIRTKEVDEFFRLVGRSDNPIGWLKAGQGLVLPSVWEGMPNVVLEAMACSKPVIATDVHGVVDVAEDLKSGWISSGCDSDLFARLILKWMESETTRKEYGAAGRKRVEEHFTIEQTVKKWENLLTRMVDG